MIDEATVNARIAALEAELVAYVAQANAMVQAYQAAIGELKRLIAPPDAQTEHIEQAAVAWAGE